MGNLENSATLSTWGWRRKINSSEPDSTPVITLLPPLYVMWLYYSKRNMNKHCRERPWELENINWHALSSQEVIKCGKDEKKRCRIVNHEGNIFPLFFRFNRGNQEFTHSHREREEVTMLDPPVWSWWWTIRQFFFNFKRGGNHEGGQFKNPHTDTNSCRAE